MITQKISPFIQMAKSIPHLLRAYQGIPPWIMPQLPFILLNFHRA